MRKGLSLLLLLSCATENKKLRAYDDLALSFLSEKLYAECLSAVDAALVEDPHRLSSLNLKGICLMELEKYPEAEKILLEVCEKTSTPECWSNLASLYQRSNQTKKCHIASKKALDVNSYNSPENALSNQALCYLSEKKFSEAQSAIEKAKLKAPQNCNVRLVSVLTSLRRGAMDDAMREIEHTLTICPSDPAVHFWSAYVFFKDGQKNAAYKRFEFLIGQFRKGAFVEASKSNLELLENHIPIPEPKL